MPKLEAKPYELVPAGMYRAMIVSIEEQKNAQGQPFLRWTYRLPDHNNYDLKVNTGYSFGPNSTARKWAIGALGRPIQDYEVIDTDEMLVGRWVQIMVSQEQKGDRAYNNVDAVAALQGVPQTPPMQIRAELAKSQGNQGGGMPPIQQVDGRTYTLDRANNSWVPDEPKHLQGGTARPQDPIFPDEAGDQGQPHIPLTLDDRLANALDYLKYEPAQAAQEFRKALTGDAFTDKPVPKWRDLDDTGDKLRVVHYFEDKVTELKKLRGELPEEPDDIPF